MYRSVYLSKVIVAVFLWLLSGHKTSEGQEALEDFAGTSQFYEFPESIDSAIVRIRELFDIVQTQALR